MDNLVFELRSMPVWLLQSYLEEIGGQRNPDGQYSGDGWSAKIEEMEDYKIGSLSVGRVRLIFNGDKNAIQITLPQLEQKMMRAGG